MLICEMMIVFEKNPFVLRFARFFPEIGRSGGGRDGWWAGAHTFPACLATAETDVGIGGMERRRRTSFSAKPEQPSSDVVDVWIFCRSRTCVCSLADTVVFVAHPWQEVTEGKWTRFAYPSVY